MRECNYPIPDCTCSYHVQSSTTVAFSINFWQAGAHTTETNKSKHSTQVLIKGIRAVVSPTDSFVTKLRAEKCHDQTSVMLRNLQHNQVMFGVYQARESKKGLSRGHYPKAWLQSPAAAHPQALDIVTAFSLQQNELAFSQKYLSIFPLPGVSE